MRGLVSSLIRVKKAENGRNKEEMKKVGCISTKNSAVSMKHTRRTHVTGLRTVFLRPYLVLATELSTRGNRWANVCIFRIIHTS